MENLAGSKVWVIEFSDRNVFDENGIFSTRDKALAYLDDTFERLKDTWKNRTLIDKDNFNDEPSWYVWSFDCLYAYEGQAEVHLYCTEIL